MSPCFDHIGLLTAELDRSVAFYRDVLGFEFVSRRSGKGGNEQAVFRVGDGLVILRAEGRSVAKGRNSASGMHHLAFCLEPKEYDAVIEACQRGGVEVTRQALNKGARGIGLAAYFRDPDGNHLEIKKYSELPEKTSDAERP